uniref:Uncharacterized protein n=1 Tax=Micrurus surinamensis TaxID=129470 RepID=A0A2D4NWB4_MICSU
MGNELSAGKPASSESTKDPLKKNRMAERNIGEFPMHACVYLIVVRKIFPFSSLHKSPITSSMWRYPFIAQQIKKIRFSVGAPTLWNELPTDLRICQDLRIFKAKLKTYLFKESGLA